MTDATSSAPPAPPCCPPGSWPQLLRSDKDAAPPPKGQVVPLSEDFQVYFSPPTGVDTTARGSIIVFPDVYSIPVFADDSEHLPTSFGRLEGICDALAEQGYAVVMPNLLGDQPFDQAVAAPSTDKGETYVSQDVFEPDGAVAWFQTNNYDKLKPRFDQTVEFLVDKVGPDMPIGGLGFCFGTWFMTKASAKRHIYFNCAVACHPATILESAVHGGNEVELLQRGVRSPTLWLTAKNDSAVFQKGGEGREIIEKQGGGKVIEFPDMVHGWVARGDTGSDETVQRDVDKAMSCIVDWFDKNM